jgi:hypothetical protein
MYEKSEISSSMSLMKNAGERIVSGAEAGVTREKRRRVAYGQEDICRRQNIMAL